MSRIIYKSHRTEFRGTGKKKRLSVTALFHDEARPDKPIIYDYSAIENAIADRKRKCRETKGLEYGREKVLEEYTSRGVAPPETRKARRRRVKAFMNG